MNYNNTKYHEDIMIILHIFYTVINIKILL